MIDKYNDKLCTSNEVIQWNEWGDLKCLQKPAIVDRWRLIPRHCVQCIGSKAGEWNDCGWYNENECEMENRNPGQESQRKDMKQTKKEMICGIDEF